MNPITPKHREITRAIINSFRSTGVSFDQTCQIIANELSELEKDKERLEGLLNLTDKESDEGVFKVTLSYDNYQDGALVLDSNGKAVGKCYDIGLKPNEQFRQAIDSAMKGQSE